MPKIVGISGSIAKPSRTRNLVEHILTETSQKTHRKYDLIDIADIAAEVGATLSYERIPEAVLEAYRKLSEADIIVIASPIYKASYTGLLKHFLDLIDPKILSGKIAILAATGGSDQHTLVLESHLRPLASFFGLITVPTAIYARDSEFVDYQLHSEAISTRIRTAADQAARLIASANPVALAA
jgi:FMN reductase